MVQDVRHTHFYFISTLLLDHVLLKINIKKGFFAIEGPKIVLKILRCF